MFREVKRVCFGNLLKRVRKHNNSVNLIRTRHHQRRAKHYSAKPSLITLKRESRRSEVYYLSRSTLNNHSSNISAENSGGSFRSGSNDNNRTTDRINLRSSSSSSSLSSSTVDFDRGKEWLRTMSLLDVTKRAILFKVISIPSIARYLIAIQRSAMESSTSSHISTQNQYKSIWKRAVNWISHSMIFPTFCGGETVVSCMESTKMFWKTPGPGQGIEIILDQSTEEQTGGPSAFDANCENKIRVIKDIAIQSRRISEESQSDGIDRSIVDDDDDPPVVVRVNAIKLTAIMEGDLLGRMTTLINREFKDQGGGDPRPFMNDNDLKDLDEALMRCQKIINVAIENKFQLFLDAEQVTRNPGINFVSRELMKRNHNQAGYPVLYNTYQLYLKDAPQWIKYDLSFAQQSGFVPGVKLVRGAYMTQEKQWAKERGDPDPICDGIHATHEQYNRMVAHVLHGYAAASSSLSSSSKSDDSNSSSNGKNKSGGQLALAVCTHNRQSLELLSDECAALNINPREEPYLLTGQLLGMCDHMAFAMKARGFRAFKLAVFGRFQDIWPFLMRRLDENAEMLAATSNENHVFAKEVRRRLGFPF